MENNKIKNLNLVHSSEMAREYGRKGGIRSGESKRRKKSMQKTLEMFMSLKLPESMNDKKELLASLGIDKSDFTAAVTIAIIMKAVGGDTKAYELIRDTLGEKAEDKINISGLECSLQIPDSIQNASLEELRAMRGIELPKRDEVDGKTEE